MHFIAQKREADKRYHGITACNFCLKERVMCFRHMNAEQERRWVNSGANRTRRSVPSIIMIFKVFQGYQVCTTTNNRTNHLPAIES